MTWRIMAHRMNPCSHSSASFGDAFASPRGIIVVSALFPGTIEVTLSNLICIDADEGKLPLEEMSFLRGMPFVKCHPTQ